MYSQARASWWSKSAHHPASLEILCSMSMVFSGRASPWRHGPETCIQSHALLLPHAMAIQIHSQLMSENKLALEHAKIGSNDQRTSWSSKKILTIEMNAWRRWVRCPRRFLHPWIWNVSLKRTRMIYRNWPKSQTSIPLKISIVHANPWPKIRKLGPTKREKCNTNHEKKINWPKNWKRADAPLIANPNRDFKENLASRRKSNHHRAGRVHLDEGQRIPILGSRSSLTNWYWTRVLKTENSKMHSTQNIVKTLLINKNFGFPMGPQGSRGKNVRKVLEILRKYIQRKTK